MTDELVSVQGISKSFGATIALRDINFSVKEGEVHVLLGENGAGKSTLMKILSGVHKPDTGEIFWKGKKIELANPVDAISTGIAMVYQELALVKHMNAVDNILLGHLPKKKNSNFIDWSSARTQVAEILKSFDLQIDLDRAVRNFNLGVCQLIEIAKVISRNAKLIILDEPTSALTLKEVDTLFFIIERLKKKGISFIYITHKLKEVFTIADRVTVLRDGRMIATLEEVNKRKKTELINLMVGRKLSDQIFKENNVAPKVRFRICNLNDREKLKNINLEVRTGEILGIAGIMGAGMTELSEAIFGLRRIVSGSVEVDDAIITNITPLNAINNKIGLIRNDRKNNLMLHMSIKQNITVSSNEKCVNNGFRIKANETELAEEYVKMLQIVCGDINNSVGSLSGGNQQKVAIARWLCNNSQVLILDDPTRGIDIGAKHEVYGIMNKLTKQGVSIIFISSELPELIGMSDRIIVMRNGEFVSEFTRQDVTQEKIMQYAAGA